MPWRLFGFIFFFGVVLVFSIFNWKNTCDISLGFATLKEVPVYLTVFASFLIGLVCSVPYAISARIKARKAKRDGGDPGGKDTSKKKGGGKTGDGEAGKIYPNDGSYGVD
jgi:uncharacterized integral membrane protein